MKQVVYTASLNSQQIHVWHLNSEGSLTLVQIVHTPGKIQPMTISPDKRFLYVGTRPNFYVISYLIIPEDGKLIWIANTPLPGSPTYISTDHQGQFLFSCSYSRGCVSVNRLKHGIPQEIIDKIEGLDGCHSVNISPDNRILWVPTLKQDRIYLFTLSSNGKLISKIPTAITTAKGSGPRHMIFHPNQKYAYVINELNSSVDVWQLKKSNKKITCVQTLDIMPENFSDTRWAADIHITPDGHHIYTCDRKANIITIFSVSEDGSILTIKGFQSTEVQPRDFNIDHNGKYLIVAGQKSNYITLYKIYNSQGFLKVKNRYKVGQEPVWIAIKDC